MSRLFRLLPVACALAFLAACSSPQPDPMLDTLRTTQPAAGAARLVVYFPSRFMGGDDAVKVDMDGRSFCDFKSGRYFVREITPVTHDFAFAYCGTRNLTHVTLTPIAGQTYYLRIMPYDSSITGMISGYPSEQVDKDNEANASGAKKSGTREEVKAPPRNGKFEVRRIGKETALEALASLKYTPGFR